LKLIFLRHFRPTESFLPFLMGYYTAEIGKTEKVIFYMTGTISLNLLLSYF